MLALILLPPFCSDDYSLEAWLSKLPVYIARLGSNFVRMACANSKALLLKLIPFFEVDFLDLFLITI